MRLRISLKLLIHIDISEWSVYLLVLHNNQHMPVVFINMISSFLIISVQSYQYSNNILYYIIILNCTCPWVLCSPFFSYIKIKLVFLFVFYIVYTWKVMFLKRCIESNTEIVLIIRCSCKKYCRRTNVMPQ